MSNLVKIPNRRIASGRRAGDRKHSQKAIPATIKAEVYSRDKGKCFCCSKYLNGNPTYEHFIPRSHGGTNAADNIFLCCLSTNNFFGSKSAGEKMRMILQSPHRKLNCSSISEIMKLPTELQPQTKKDK
jgi:5-methylcytosine-specific restriction endonuclease McrA